MKTYAINNPDTGVRTLSSAGGFFSMLAERCLNNGGVVYGVGFDDDFNIVHLRTDKIDTLNSIRRSKYAYSDAKQKIKEAIADLNTGTEVLFSGTPCQIAAIRKLTGDNPNLLCIEVVCHGAPKHEYWEKYILELCAKNKKNITEIADINFRDKRTGWKNYSFTVKFKDGSEYTERYDKNLFMQGFLRDLTLREACFSCPFKYPNGSKADITLGDLWGISYIAPELDNDLGTTLVIARTQKGEKIIASLYPKYEIDFKQASKYNPAIIQPVSQPAAYHSFQQYALNHSFLKTVKKYTEPPLKQRIRSHLGRVLRSLKLNK